MTQISGRNRKALNGLRNRLVRESAKDKFRQDTPPFAKALKTARRILGVKYEDAEHLAEHLASVARSDINHMVCIKCGRAGPKSSAHLAKSPFGIVWEAELRNPAIAGFTYAIQFITGVEEVKIRHDLVIRNGFCLDCSRKMRRRFPRKLREYTRDRRKPKQPKHAETVEEVLTVLQEHNVIFNEKSFREAFNKSIQI